jgi:hypothetical protein
MNSTERQPDIKSELNERFTESDFQSLVAKAGRGKGMLSEQRKLLLIAYAVLVAG